MLIDIKQIERIRFYVNELCFDVIVSQILKIKPLCNRHFIAFCCLVDVVLFFYLKNIVLNKKIYVFSYVGYTVKCIL